MKKVKQKGANERGEHLVPLKTEELKCTIIDFLGITKQCAFYFKQRFGDWTLHLSSSKKPTFLGPVDRAKVPKHCCK